MIPINAQKILPITLNKFLFLFGKNLGNRNSLPVFGVLLLAVLLSGCALPKAILVNDVKMQSKVEPEKNGFICFKSDISMGTELRLKAMNLASKKTLLISTAVNKNSLGSHVNSSDIAGTSASIESEMLNDSVLIYQLPEGEYQFSMAYFEKSHTPSQVRRSVISDHFTIQKNTMTYIGDLEVRATWHSFVKYLTQSDIVLHDQKEKMQYQLSLVNAFGIDRMKMNSQIIQIKLK